MAFTARTETFARDASLTTPFDFTINKATGAVDGDIMFMFLAMAVTAPAATVDSVPGGWTLVATNATENYSWYLYYKIASSEGASYTWSLNKSCRYYALNIAYSSGDFSVAGLGDITVSNTLYSGADNILRAASMNVPNANSPLVYFGAVYSTAVRTFTKPTVPTSDWVEDADEGHITPDISVTNGSMIWTSSGLTGNMDITCSASLAAAVKHAFAVALKPLSPVLVTPTTLDNTVTFYIPTVTALAPQLMTPTTLDTVITLFVPTVTASDFKLVTPDTLATVITLYEPTVTAIEGGSAESIPATLDTIITLYEPTVTALAPILVTPGVLELTITPYVPTITVTNHITVTIPALNLVITAYIPVITAINPILVTPETLALITSLFEPSVLLPVVVTVPTLVLGGGGAPATGRLHVWTGTAWNQAILKRKSETGWEEVSTS